MKTQFDAGTDRKIVLVMPVHNHIEYTKKALTGLEERSGLPIIVVDDGSTDGTSEWIRENYPDVHLLSGKGNLWWTGGINVGVHHALTVLKADYVVLWNNDTIFAPDYFDKLPGLLDENTLVGSKVYAGSKVWSMGGRFNPVTGDYFMQGYFKNDGPEYMVPCEADWLAGMGTVISRKVIETIGYWDYFRFPQYHGDSDFTYRAKLAGFNLLVHPGLILYNDVSNTGQARPETFKELAALLTSIRSKSNMAKNFLFYRLYATSYKAFMPLVWKYVQIIGGFCKRKIAEIWTPRAFENAIS